MAPAAGVAGARIPCVVVTHGRDSVNRQSVEAIIACDPRLDVRVLHNPSVLEDGSFVEYARGLVEQGTIRSLTLFDENISNNALLLPLLESSDLYEHDYVILTDGDVVPPAKLVEEQIAILDAHPEFMACGLRVDASLWTDALPVKADSLERFNTTRFEAEDYLDSTTGLWMTLFRGSELHQLIELLAANAIRFTDANVKMLGALVLHKKWVATKRSMGRELTREQPDYYDAKATSTSAFGAHSPEPAGSRYSTWNHDLVCPATEWAGTESRRLLYRPLAPAQPRFRSSIETDAVVRALLSGELEHANGYVVRHSSFAVRPGLAFVLSRESKPSGIPWLPGPKSILFLSPEDAAGSQLHQLKELNLDASLITWTAEEATRLLQVFSRFVGEGSLVKGIVFDSVTVRRHLSEGTPPPPNHLPPALRDRAVRLAAEGSSANEAELAAFVSELCSDALMMAFARLSGWDVQVSPPTPGRQFAYVRLTVAGAAAAETLESERGRGGRPVNGFVR